MTESDLKEIERDLEFASMNRRTHFYISKETAFKLVHTIRDLLPASAKVKPTTPEEYMASINMKLDIILKFIDSNN